MAADSVDIHRGFHDVDATGAGAAFEEYLVAMHRYPAWVESRAARQRLAAIARGARVLDAGCGIGMDLPDLAAAVGPDGAITAFDLSADLLDRAKVRAAALSTPIDYRQGDLQHLPFPDATFDVVWSERVLMYLARPLDAVREIRRVLRPGGRFVAGEIDFSSVWAVSADETLRQALQDSTMASVENPGLARHLPGLCHQAGFDSVTVEPTLAIGRSFDAVERASNLIWHLDRFVEQGRVTRAQADAWLHVQRRSSAEGRFVSIVGILSTVATRAG
jgi:ubiquinone/menaquinone biosynthesis C-methylase UbiE